MYLYALKIEDDKLIAVLRAARRLPPEAWQLVRELIKEVSHDAHKYSASSVHRDTPSWEPVEELGLSVFEALDSIQVGGVDTDVESAAMSTEATAR